MFRYIRDRRGVSLVLVTLSIFMLLGFTALSIDVAHIYNVKDQLQSAADAAALAGAARLDGTNTTAQPKARAEATRVAGLNFADSIKVSLLNSGNTDAPNTNDIVVGYWDGTTFTPGTAPSGKNVNAVLVAARRMNSDKTSTQPKVSNWFAFLVSGLGYDFTAVSAKAIAAQESAPPPFLPVAVNEYWDVGDKGVPGNPYGQLYPESFMRSVNADGSHGITPGTIARGGQIFAMLGANANLNDSANNSASVVDVLLRNRFHNGRGPGTFSPPCPKLSSWWLVDTTVNGSCASCDSSLIAQAAGVKTGTVNSDKFGIVFDYLFTGIPRNILLPNAVREIIRTPLIYPVDNYTDTTDPDGTGPCLNTSTSKNDPSNCAYATLAFYSGSGGTMLTKKGGPDNITFHEKWKKGDQFIVMVYDGSHVTNPDHNQADTVTVIGYGKIQLDGFSTGQIKTVSDFASLDPGGPGSNVAGTAYAHAIPHGLPNVDDGVTDATDTYIVQPSKNVPNPINNFLASPCTYDDTVIKMQAASTNVHLVQPNLSYGMANK